MCICKTFSIKQFWKKRFDVKTGIDTSQCIQASMLYHSFHGHIKPESDSIGWVGVTHCSLLIIHKRSIEHHFSRNVNKHGKHVLYFVKACCCVVIITLFIINKYLLPCLKLEWEYFIQQIDIGNTDKSNWIFFSLLIIY